MQAYRPERLVRVLSAGVTIAYYVVWVVTVLGLVGIPVARVLAVRSSDLPFELEAPVTLDPPTLPLGQGVGAEITHVRAKLSVPIGRVSTGAVVLNWIAGAVLSVLELLFLHHLRRLFQRVKAGAPFDAANATHLRWLGILLLALGLAWGVYKAWMSLLLSNLVEGRGNQLGTNLGLNLPLLFVALFLIVLGEIFRRGAALEDEQSLVV